MPRRIWKIPPTSHKYNVHNLSSGCKMLLEKRIMKLIHNALNNNNMMCAQVIRVRLRCKNSPFTEKYRPISQTVFMLSIAVNRAEHV